MQSPRIVRLPGERPTPSPLRGEQEMMRRFSTGSAAGRCAAASLHPWLQPIAPPGRQVTLDAIYAGRYSRRLPRRARATGCRRLRLV